MIPITDCPFSLVSFSHVYKTINDVICLRKSPLPYLLLVTRYHHKTVIDIHFIRVNIKKAKRKTIILNIGCVVCCVLFCLYYVLGFLLMLEFMTKIINVYLITF